MSRRNIEWPAVIGGSAIFLILAGVITLIVYFSVQEQRAKTECWNSGGIVAESRHGDGWNCVQP